MAPRVSPPRLFPEAAAAPKPPAGSPGADAYRTTAFTLGADVERVVDGLNAEGAAAAAASVGKNRTQLFAATLGLWSRSWLCRLHALHATQGGNYVAAIPLLRAAADYQASMLYVLRDQASEWHEWLEAGGIAKDAADRATEYRLHAFRAAEILAAHDILGPLYRAATDLSLSHFGATLLLAGSESTPERLMLSFGDRDFHAGLAELCLGWLLELGAALEEVLAEFRAVYLVEDTAALTSRAGESVRIARAEGRCRIDLVERGGEQRYLVTNWRRNTGAVPGRILL